MHEYGIAQEMVSVALQQAKENQAHRITHFRIEMSDMADESEDSLRFYLENLTRGTVANEAKFEIQRVRIPMHCLKCGKEFEKEDTMPKCPRCHSTHVMQNRLDEFKLSSIEIE